MAIDRRCPRCGDPLPLDGLCGCAPDPARRLQGRHARHAPGNEGLRELHAARRRLLTPGGGREYRLMQSFPLCWVVGAETSHPVVQVLAGFGTRQEPRKRKRPCGGLEEISAARAPGETRCPKSVTASEQRIKPGLPRGPSLSAPDLTKLLARRFLLDQQKTSQKSLRDARAVARGGGPGRRRKGLPRASALALEACAHRPPSGRP
jgi:hypothetical protein